MHDKTVGLNDFWLRHQIWNGMFKITLQMISWASKLSAPSDKTITNITFENETVPVGL